MQRLLYAHALIVVTITIRGQRLLPTHHSGPVQVKSSLYGVQGTGSAWFSMCSNCTATSLCFHSYSIILDSAARSRRRRCPVLFPKDRYLAWSVSCTTTVYTFEYYVMFYGFRCFRVVRTTPKCVPMGSTASSSREQRSQLLGRPIKDRGSTVFDRPSFTLLSHHCQPVISQITSTTGLRIQTR